MENRTKLTLSLIAVLTFFTVTYWAIECKGFGIRYNRSSSLSYTIFLARKTQTSPQKGEIVTCKHPEIQTPIAKIVAGIPGDNINYSKMHFL